MDTNGREFFKQNPNEATCPQGAWFDVSTHRSNALRTTHPSSARIRVHSRSFAVKNQADDNRRRSADFNREWTLMDANLSPKSRVAATGAHVSALRARQH